MSETSKCVHCGHLYPNHFPDCPVLVGNGREAAEKKERCTCTDENGYLTRKAFGSPGQTDPTCPLHGSRKPAPMDLEQLREKRRQLKRELHEKAKPEIYQLAIHFANVHAEQYAKGFSSHQTREALERVGNIQISNDASAQAKELQYLYRERIKYELRRLDE